MNIGFFKRPKIHTVLITLFCAGIMASLCAQYLLVYHFSQRSAWQILALLAVTFFVGIVSIYVTARSKKQVVVYREGRKDNAASQRQKEVEANSQLNIGIIKKIIEARHDVGQKTINELCRQLQAGQGAIYTVTADQTLTLTYGYALSFDKDAPDTYAFGDGLIGRVAAEGRTLYIDNLPFNYITIFSGLGAASPSHLVMVPIKNESNIKGVIEIATFGILHDKTIADLEALGQELALVTLHKEER